MRKRRSNFFVFVRIIVLFFMGLIVATVIALSQVNLETLRGNMLGVLRDATGLPVEVEGNVSWKLSLRPRIELNQVRVRNADWAKHEYAFSAERVDVRLNLLSLFRSRPTIQNVKIYDATICVEKNESGELSMKPFWMNKNALDASDSGIAQKQDVEKYPFKDPGLGGIEIKNLVAHMFDSSYSLAGLNIRDVSRNDIREYAGWIKTGEDVFPFIMSFSEYNLERKVYPVRIAFATGGDALIANVALEGTSKMPIDFIVKGDVPDVKAVGRIFNLDLSKVPALKLNIAGGMGHHKLTLRKSSLSLRGNEFVFLGDIDWSKDVTYINLDVSAGKISLGQLFPDLYGKKWNRPDRDLYVFKDVNLHGKEWLGVNFLLHADIDDLVVYRDLSIADIDLNVRSANGIARVDVNVEMGGGDIKIGSDINIDDTGYMSALLGMRGENILVGEILNQVGTDNFISELPMNIDMYVMANGKNLSEIMQTITGPVQVYSVAPGYAHSALVSYMYGTDFLTTLRHSIQDLFRSEKKYDQIKISCVALNTKLRNGRLETQHGAAIETNAINVRMAGALDLGNENMKLSLTTVPVRGLKLSLTGNVVNSAEITGNLAEPSIQINGAAVAGKVASATGIGLLLAPLTGGIGLVAGAGVGLLAGDLLENWLADDHPCRTAMERGAPDRRDDPEWMATPVADLVRTTLKIN